MKLRHVLPTALMSAAALAGSGAAHAETLLYDGISLFSGQQSFTDSFTLTTPGTLNITLSNIPWLDTVSDLTGFVSTSSGMIGNAIGAGTESLSVGPGTYYAHWFGDAQGVYNLGVVGMQIGFQPSGMSAVPLPTTLILLLSGLGVLLGWQGRRAPDSVSQIDDNALTT
jgi:hypothetical protein